MNRLLLAALMVTTAACSKKQNVLFVTFDTTRADAVGYAGSDRGITPTLDALAKKGVWFSTAMTAQPLTLPSHATIFTGLYPYNHGVRNNGTYVLDAGQTTLAERLRGAGYATHAVVSSFVLDHRFGLNQGFDQYDDDLLAGRRNVSIGMRETTASRVAEKAIRWLRSRDGKKPFFLWLHFYDPHSDYRPPGDIALRYPGEPYKGEIHYADRELGRVVAELEKLELDDDTLIVFTGDHGEGLGEHDEREHGMFVYDATMHVPMFLSGPGVPAGKRIDGVVRTADLTPTVLDLLGVRDQSRFDGGSLLPMLDGKESAPRQAYLESLYGRLNFGWAELRALRTRELKAVDAPEREVYAVDRDAKETKNLAAGDPGGARPLFAGLQRLAKSDPFARGEQNESAIDAETRRQLAALGYVSGQGGAPRAGGPRPDPKARREEWHLFQSAQELSSRKQFRSAAMALERLLQRDPGNSTAMLLLGGAQSSAGDHERALATFKGMLDADPSNHHAAGGAVQSLIQMRRAGEAEELLQALLRARPESADARMQLGEVYLAQDRFVDAEASFRAALELDPDATLAISGLGNTLNRAGRQKEALQVLKDGLKKQPSSSAIAYNLAVVTERLGDTRGASLLYQMAVRLEPENAKAWNNLGSLFNRAGKSEDAIRCVSRAVAADPNSVEAIFNLGSLLVTHGRPAQGLPYLERALRQSPGLLPAVAQRAVALTALGRREPAAAAWVDLARLELARGNQAGARDALRRGTTALGAGVTTLASRDARLKALL